LYFSIEYFFLLGAELEKNPPLNFLRGDSAWDTPPYPVYMYVQIHRSENFG